MSFRTNTPAIGDSFYDREDEVARLVRVGERLREGVPVWTAVIGRRKVGKTSLLLEVARRLRTEGPACAIIDVFEELPVSMQFFRRYALRVADTLLQPTLGASLEAQVRQPQAYAETLTGAAVLASLPGELRSFLLELPRASVDADFVRLSLQLPERLAEALDRRLIVAIDEFQELAGMRRGSHPDPLPLMRSLWQRHERVSYIISGSARSMLINLITDRRSPFFQHFDILELGELPIAEALAMLEDGGLPQRLAREMIDLLGGHPFYLQILGEELLRGPRPLDRSALKQVMQRVLFSRTGRLALYFEGEYQRVVGKSATLAATFRAAADGPSRLTDVAAEIGASAGSTSRYLNRLRDVVMQDEDGRYRVADPVFGMWLRWRRPGGSVVPMRILGDEGEATVADRLARSGFDIVYQSRASRGAFDLLATRGTAQLGVQVKRRKLPLSFTAEEWNRMEADAGRLGWSWLVAAVDPGDERVRFLDPALARHGRRFSLGADAEVTNVVAWIAASPVD
jgi:AAA+ ATPase superfamily predicted ATPase